VETVVALQLTISISSVLNIGYQRYTGRENYVPDTG